MFLLTYFMRYCDDKDSSTQDKTIKNVVNTDTTTFIPPTIDEIIVKKEFQKITKKTKIVLSMKQAIIQ